MLGLTLMGWITTSILLAETSSLQEWLLWLGNLSLVFIGLGFVIFVHELGHFLVAKACGVKCEKFYVGFDFFDIPLGFYTIPRSLVKFQWGETEYGIGSIPLGGYVKMLGQDDNPSNAEEEAKRTRDEKGELDPRSYLAQSVPERMAIISAGVIMNIIFGFLFAAIAYRSGVKEVPAVIGATVAGDPAWQMGLLPGERILQVGRSGTPNEHLRFIKDMQVKFFLSDLKQEQEMLVRRANGKDEWFKFMPSDRLAKESPPRPTVGISPPISTTISKSLQDQLPLLPQEYKQLEAGDVIIAVDGRSIQSGIELEKYLAREPRKTITLTVERPAKNEVLEKNPTASATQHQLEIPALPMRDYGVELVSEPIFAMQADSPASKAGVKVGDRIIEFAGEPLGDPLSFPQRVLTKIGESDVPLVVEREGEKVELKITLREPVQGMWRSSAGNSVGVESMGIAYRVRNEVAHIREKGPAQDKLQPGDQLLKVRFIAATPEQAEIEKKFSLDGGAKETPLNTTTFSWINLLELATHAHFSNTTLEVTFKRDGKEQKVQLTSVDSQETFSDDRNLPCTPYSELHQADSWSEALSLGMREMKERMLEVVLTVSRLIQGKLGLGGTGGPISIIRVASSEASRGLPELLMFFAWLSANLAVMNFLPIPALDGGHMLFLTWEAIMGKPVNENLQVKLSIVGILMLLSLMLFVTVLDITRFF